ncbi:hypothetical protein ACWDSJ_20575 [Nocardia sp. NPDC003482]
MSMIIEGVAIVAVLVWIAVRQTRWRELAAGRMWRTPLVIGGVGLVELNGEIAHETIDAVTVALLAVSAALSLAVGVAMGMLSRIREFDGRVWARTGRAGSALWFALLAVRVGVDVWAHAIGARLVTSVAVILVMLALNRVGRTLVLLRRAERFRPVAAH